MFGKAAVEAQHPNFVTRGLFRLNDVERPVTIPHGRIPSRRQRIGLGSSRLAF